MRNYSLFVRVLFLNQILRYVGTYFIYGCANKLLLFSGLADPAYYGQEMLDLEFRCRSGTIIRKVFNEKYRGWANSRDLMSDM